ncbi:MAG TPA: trimethylamine methyltransferase family protein [Nocardioides sp.]|uniref:trimethylamine methyltransferase family protein n=1 Tax=Nocardioides sp. TaxID=35761 RepID=UPI002BCDF007|nr:trimethylamine methyltransferase family protein [Nocardioides sp.]HQR25981.1 trimethylamine methyltransferase family protein [Nocardioides sp.]
MSPGAASALPLEPLTPEALERIHTQAMRLLAEIGTEVHDEEMVARLAGAGQRVDGTRVRWDPDWVLGQLALAPASFTLTGRNPDRQVRVGGGSLVHCPVGGPPFAHDEERGRRDGSLADHVELVKLAHACDLLPVLQSGTVEAQDLEAASRHLEMDYSMLRWSDRPFIVYGSSGPKARDGFELAALAAGGRAALAERPMTLGIVNPNSPLVWDGLMVSQLVACAEYAQPVAITPFLLAGASAPVTLAAGLSILVAEVLSGVAMAQLVRPGTPCLLGCFFTGVDMRSGGPSLGLPESVLTTLAGAQLARRYGLPLRGGGGLCSGITLDAQASAETSMSLWATYLAGCDLVVHAAGWLEGGLVASYEKLALDLELIRMFERLREGVVVDDAALAFDVIAEEGPGGLFLAHQHTLERFRTDVFMSPLFRSQAHPTWLKQGAPQAPQVAAGEWRRLLDSYTDPGLDPDLDAALREYVDRRTREWEA